VLPFRPRPFSTPEFAHSFALGRAQRGLDTWTAFPSDHATLFAALAVGLWFASRRAGWALCIYVLVVVMLPRLYLGMHYPTDLLAGAVIGVVIAWLVNSDALRPLIAGPLTRWQTWSPASFYACAFLLTSQIAVLFDPVRHLIGLAKIFVSGPSVTPIASAP
jgi:undecaprenyl-diphosphatase